MPIFISKPILWNSDGYRQPAGIVANSGFPQEHGFGHEEWNGSPAMTFEEDGVRSHAFHTEGVGNAPVAEEAGRIFVFMYASHDRVQELVGIAGNATCLIDDRRQRETLVRRLRIDAFADQAWAVPRVRALHGEDRSTFDKVWRTDLHWIPNWRCPADTFLWLEKPVRLDPQALRGTSKLLTMFGRHTDVDMDEALMMLDFVPTAERTAAWHRIRAEIVGAEPSALAQDLSALANRTDIAETTQQRLIDARLGQGRFRADVERIWGGACSVSGCSLSPVLRASHIIAWKRSDNRQRLDGENGLLLTADLDALFDRGLISFGDDGGMIVSPQLSTADRRLFQLPRPLRAKPTAGQRRYLADHRRHWAFDA